MAAFAFIILFTFSFVTFQCEGKAFALEVDTHNIFSP